ncbi:MAG: hypothetical protein M1827_004043 [Pycnora praestabilis]|nr:MAG: hypothetical protein M1827_004043 [Pycnora praestabilis]
MRSLLPASLLSLLLLSSAIAAPPPEAADTVSPTADTLTIQTSAPIDPPIASLDVDSTPGTVFNGVQVPPFKELSGDNFDDDIKDGYWFVKFHSPYCPHCLAIAPAWQTLYEYYYTSKPLQSSSQSADSQSSLNSFHPYYNFHFASLDCVAHGSTCEAHDVHAYPTFLLYKDGKFVKKYTGKKDLAGLSGFVEESLESIRPGSRSKEGVKLPEVGAAAVAAAARPDIPVAKDKDAAGGAAAGAKHNEQVAQGATETISSKLPKSTLKATKISNNLKPTASPNLLGTSVPLSGESFQTLVTTTQDPWFIKFYVPWCHHCQALAPNWAEMAKEMAGKMNVGEVNCDVETRLCKDVRLRGYPTILFFRGGERVEYDGLRGLGDLVSFAKKAIVVGEGVKYVDAAAFKEMEETEEVIFVYFYDHATTTEDFTAMERLTLSLIGHAKIVKTDSALLAERFKITTWPRLLVSRDGRPTYFTALAPKDTRDYRKVLGWMQSNWLPIVPELTATNSREIMDGKLVVLGILTRDRPEDFVISKREIKNAALEWMDKQTQAFQLERQELRDAKQLRIEEAEDRNDQRSLRAAKSIRISMDKYERKEVGFAWVDGVFWERWIRTTYGIEVKDGEKVIVNDEDNRKYWDMTASGGFIVPSRTSILETLPKIVSSPPKLTPKSTTSNLENLFFQIRGACSGHPWVTIGALIGIIVSAAIWGRGRIRKARGPSGSSGGGFFQLDGKEGLLGGGGGGGGANGKVD